jgi:serine/threonine-protein kinase
MAQQKTGVSQLGPYRLARKLGEGGMGAVYLAEDTRDKRKVALKILPRKHGQDPDFVKRFKRETELGTKLRHAHIVGALEAGEDQGYHFYVMEYCEGEPLDRALQRENRFPVFRALEIVRQVAGALRYAHDHAVIHRDIKPGNIMLTPAGTARLLDLGLSKDLGANQTSFRTADGAIVGTPHYISPEQASGERKIDGRTDIYSLGATLYQLLTGSAPFAGSTTVEVLYQHVHSELPNPRDLRPEIPEGVVHVLRRMMAKSPEDRYRDCGDLIADLDELIGGKTPKTVVLSAKSSVALQHGAVPAKPPAAVSKSRAPALIAGGLSLILVVIGPVVFRSKPEPAPLPGLPVGPAPGAGEVVIQGTIDLLALVDPARDAVKGSWKLEKGRLVSDEENAARLELPYLPPEEYDFKVVFTRKTGNDAVNQIVPHAATVFVWQMGAFENTVFGISEINGRRANENATTLERERCLETGREYTSILEVRRNRVTASLNGQKLVDWKTNYQDLGMNDDWRLRTDAVPGLGCWGSSTEFRMIELREVSGRGRELRPRSK